MVLSPQEKEILEGFLKEAEGLDSPVLFLLHRIQEKWGQISWDSANFISKELGVPMTQIYSAATFYEEFTIKPVGKNIIRVCRGIVCHTKDSAKLLEIVSGHLGIGEGETTPDGIFTIMESSCIGQCDGAPAMMVNGTVYRDLDPDGAISILEELKEGGV
jgi:NADH-quinone oxidoreductase subunit E